MTRQPTFKTTDFDCAGGVSGTTGELPELHMTGDIAECWFYDKDAPEAARRFRNDGNLQNFISAKKTLFRLFKQARR